MKVFESLNDKNFTLFAAHHYDNPQCVDTDEFYDDLNRFKYLKRLLGRYEQSGDLQERLILNHLIVLHNIFGIPAAKKMLEFKIDQKHWPVVKPFLVYLNYVREDEYVEVPLDPNVIDRLRKI